MTNSNEGSDFSEDKGLFWTISNLLKDGMERQMAELPGAFAPTPYIHALLISLKPY